MTEPVPASIYGRAVAAVDQQYAVRTAGDPMPFRDRAAAEKWIGEHGGKLVDRVVYTTEWSTTPT